MTATAARYRSLFETSPDVILIMDDEGLVVAANPAIRRVLGYAPEDLVGHPLSRIMPDRFRTAHHDGFSRYLKTGVRKLDWTSIQLPGLTAEGREIPLAVAFGEYDQDGRRFFTGILRDVSEEKTALDRLKFFAAAGKELASASLDYHVTLVSLAQLAVPYLADWSAVDIVGADGKLERLAVAHSDPEKVSLAHEMAARYPDDPNSGRGVSEVIKTGVVEFLREIPAEMLTAAAKDEEHLRLLRSLGLRSYMIVPLSAHGRIYGAVSLIHAESGRCFAESDIPIMEELGRRGGLAIHNAELHRAAIDANRLLEEQATELEQQNEESQVLTEELEAQTEELIESAEILRQKSTEADTANRAKSEFLASMSHELRTPLNAIGGYVELIEMGLRGPVTDEQRADLVRIQSSQRHLLALINDVLNFARIDAGKLEYDVELVALDEVLKDCEAMILPQIHRKRISYRYAECGEPVHVHGDRDKIQQILLNLLSNSIKFTPEGGALTASCDETETLGRIHIADTGVGIERDKLDSVFEAFVQVNRSLSQPGDGAGLGLAISRTLARGMDGDIVVISEPGVGSTFTLSLPLIKASE